MKSWIKFLIVFTLATLATSAVYAEEYGDLVPKPVWEMCDDKACMEFEEVRKLVRMRSHYVTLYDLVPEIKRESQAWEASATSALLAAHQSNEAYIELMDLYRDTESELESAIRSKYRYKQFSVFRGGFTIVLGAAALSFASGFYLGSRL